MSVWTIAPVELRPDVTLESWAVFEVPLNGLDHPWTRHFAGYSLEDGQGQVCSPVESFDPVNGQCVTRSGRVYRLRAALGSTKTPSTCGVGGSESPASPRSGT